jgi:hypothetical protein
MSGRCIFEKKRSRLRFDTLESFCERKQRFFEKRLPRGAATLTKVRVLSRFRCRRNVSENCKVRLTEMIPCSQGDTAVASGSQKLQNHAVNSSV